MSETCPSILHPDGSEHVTNVVPEEEEEESVGDSLPEVFRHVVTPTCRNSDMS